MGNNTIFLRYASLDNKVPGAHIWFTVVPATEDPRNFDRVVL
jgi:hypothetical protein